MPDDALVSGGELVSKTDACQSAAVLGRGCAADVQHQKTPAGFRSRVSRYLYGCEHSSVSQDQSTFALSKG